MTLLDAAREYVEARVGAAQTNVDPERRAAAMTRHGMAFSALRAAIAREEERQEIIEGLVEAARHDAVIGERWACWGCGQVMPAHLPDCGFKAVRTALARYDAMKEDDRG